MTTAITITWSVSAAVYEEFESAPVIHAGETAANQYGFQLIESTLNVRGICPACR